MKTQDSIRAVKQARQYGPKPQACAIAAVALGALLAFGQVTLAGTWTPLANQAPGYVTVMLLLSDGTVMAASQPGGTNIGNGWYRLTPDIHGSYINGTWTTLAPMHDTRYDYSSAVLRDGRVFVAGGEYGTGTSTAEVYDPVFNTWTTISPTGAFFSDSNCKVLPDGTVLIDTQGSFGSYDTFIYNSVSGAWSAGSASLQQQAETSWVKLPDDSILTVDADMTRSERYLPSLNRWIRDADLPVSLWLPLVGFVGEIGPAFLLANGTALFLGGNGATALYTPSGGTNVGSWVQGPTLPNSLSAADSPAAMMNNGKVLCALAAKAFVQTNNVIFPPPTYFYEYDPVANSFTQVSSPTGGLSDNIRSYEAMMLDLPDGTVLYSDTSTQLYVYRPSGPPLASGKPAIAGIVKSGGTAYRLGGTLLNGISAGAAFGDDAQMDSNYPLVRLTDGSGNVYYARTFNWSSTGVMTGGRLVTTDFTLPDAVANGGPAPYLLVVVANGISSDPVTFFGPVWVDFNYTGSLQFGTFFFPYSTFGQGVTNVPFAGTIALKGNASSPEKMTITTPLSVYAVGGPATIGR